MRWPRIKPIKLPGHPFQYRWMVEIDPKTPNLTKPLVETAARHAAKLNKQRGFPETATVHIVY
jgi:hypothetical protein